MKESNVATNCIDLFEFKTDCNYCQYPLLANLYTPPNTIFIHKELNLLFGAMLPKPSGGTWSLSTISVSVLAVDARVN